MTKDPLIYINLYRAKAAQRPLDPKNPQGQTEPWTQFDIEHYALDLGWEPPVGYRLARDPRLPPVWTCDNPYDWWHMFFDRYYRAGLRPMAGNITISHNFGPKVGTLLIGEIVKRAEIEPSPTLQVPWPTADSTPVYYRECVINAVRYVEQNLSGVKWPLSLADRQIIINRLSEGMGSALPPKNLTMPMVEETISWP